MELPPKKLREALIHICLAGLVPMVTGPPGTGKSDIVNSIAEQFDLELLDERLSTKEPVDLAGFPSIQNGRATFIPPDWVPLQDLDKVPKGKKGWLLFLDEFNSASPATQAAAYKLVLDKKLGKFALHKNVWIICAGNNETDMAIVNRLSTAMQSRLIHLQLSVSPNDWLEWAAINNLDFRVTSYIEHRPEILHKFDPDHNDRTFACSRTWFFSSKLIKGQTDLRSMLPVLAGTISEGVAREFISYSTLCTKLPSIKEIVAQPTTIQIDQEPSMLYAVSHMIAAYLDSKNAAQIMQYVDRLPMEFGTITMQSAFKRNSKLATLPEVRTWRTTLANAIFS